MLPKGNGVLQSPFLDDDAALAFDGAVGHRGRTRPVVHQQQAGVQLCRVVAGNAIEQVAHRVATREGIAVVAEVDAVAAHEVHDLRPREMLGAAEQHVLHEVCHAPFVVLLEHGTGLDKQAEVGLPLGLGAASDVVGHTVLQHALAHGGIGGNLLPVDDLQVRHQQRVLRLLGEG